MIRCVESQQLLTHHFGNSITININVTKLHLKFVAPNTQIIHGFNGLLNVHVFREMNN